MLSIRKNILIHLVKFSLIFAIFFSHNLQRFTDSTMQMVNDFHQAILDVFKQNPMMKKKFLKYVNKFSSWCAREHHAKLYKGNNYDQYLINIKSMPLTSNLTKVDQSDILKKPKLETENHVNLMEGPPIQEFHHPQNLISFQHEIQKREMEIHRRDSIIVNLLSSLISKEPLGMSQLNFGPYKICIEPATNICPKEILDHSSNILFGFYCVGFQQWG